MQHFDYSVKDVIAEITLRRPPVNALSIPMLEEILSAFQRAKDDDSVRAVILASALPRRFCAGLDLDILMEQQRDRESVVVGQSVSGRVDLGGRRIIKKKKTLQNHHDNP